MARSGAAERRPHTPFFIAAVLAGLLPAGAIAHAQTVVEKTETASLEEAATPLYLGVVINGNDTRLVASFSLHPDGRMSSPASELAELGIRTPSGSGAEVFLDTLAGLSYSYDEQAQVLAITAEDDALLAKQISGSGKTDLLAPQPGFGSVLNYGIYASTPDELLDGNAELSGASLSLDHRLYTPYGVLTNTGAIRTVGLSYEGATAIRAESSFNYADQETMTSYTVGDVVSSSLPWTRPIRLGGGQVKRDFGMRSDIITTPLLTASGSAALPSTVDVFIGNVRTYTGSVDPGPFVLTDVPVIDRQGNARIVLRDVSGRQTEVSVPFYAAQYLLKEGMLDYSVEAGFARQDFGQDSFSYGSDPVVSGSIRYGLTDRLTLEAHAEAKPDLIMGGAGLSTVLFNRAEVSIAAGGSAYDGETGFFVHGRLSTEFHGFDLDVSSFRSFGDFADLAYVTGVDEFGRGTLADDFSYLEPPKAMDVVSLGIPLFFDDSSVNLSLVHAQRRDDEDLILSASYSRSIGWRDASIRINGFMDFAEDGGLGLVAGFSMPLGGERHFNAGLARDPDGALTPAASVQKPLGSDVGSYGYHVDGTGTDFYGQGGAGASYRSSFGVAEARVSANKGRASASASFDGALVVAGGGVFASNTVTDSFAIVDAGVPDVPVLLQNQQVTRTGRNGKALVPGLRSYSRNKVSIDVTELPVDAIVAATDETVIPARASGVLVDFRGGTQAAALLVLRDGSGQHVQPGSLARLNGSDAESHVGYDGQLWLEGLAAENTITVQNGGTTCTASFSYAPDPGNQVIIDPVECK
ncbi:fimbria/pilus outer membrane usher protein [Aestuariivirga sp.]|uniref:fimbria/pilus outer membrane usher protein n=1 Tax=Aestuariivirga sp. TaxID=2650926 RepID=UPI00391B3D5E